MTTLEKIERAQTIFKGKLRREESLKLTLCDALASAKSDLIRLEAERKELREVIESMLHEYTTTAYEGVGRLRSLGQDVDSAEAMRAAFCHATGCEKALAKVTT